MNVGMQMIFSDNPAENKAGQGRIAAILEERVSKSKFYGPLLYHMCHLYIVFNCTRPAQSRIAGWLGCSVRTVYTILEQLAEDGLVTRKYHHLNTCIYSVAPWLIQKNVMVEMVKVIPDFKALLAAIKYKPDGYVSQRYHFRVNQGKNSYIRMLSISGGSISKEQGMKMANVVSVLKKSLSILGEKNDTAERGKDAEERALHTVVDMTFSSSKSSSKPPKIDSPSSRLTDDAKSLLVAFPEDIVEEGIDKMQYFPQIINKLGWLRKFCTNRCRERNITPDWRLASLVKDKLQLKDDVVLFKPTDRISRPNLLRQGSEGHRKKYVPYRSYLPKQMLVSPSVPRKPRQAIISVPKPRNIIPAHREIPVGGLRAIDPILGATGMVDYIELLRNMALEKERAAVVN